MLHDRAPTKWLLRSSLWVTVTASLYFVVCEFYKTFETHADICRHVKGHNCQHMTFKNFQHPHLVYDVQNVCFVSIRVA